MQTVRLRYTPSALPLPSLRTPPSVIRRFNPSPRTLCLTNPYLSAYRAQKRCPIRGLVYKRTDLQAKNFSTNNKPQVAPMTETVIREVTKDVWIFSK